MRWSIHRIASIRVRTWLIIRAALLVGEKFKFDDGFRISGSRFMLGIYFGLFRKNESKYPLMWNITLNGT
jgi:hypothetical protein